jgi:hypothetical protein
MSSNTQVHVESRERFSLESALGPGGAQVLCGVLQKLGARQFPEDICRELPWQPVSGSERIFHRQVGAHRVELSLQRSVPKLTISGMQTSRAIPHDVMQAAHAAVNQVLALAVSDRIAERLSTYAGARVSEVAHEKVTQTVALKALQLQNARLAIRASCGVLVKS